MASNDRLGKNVPDRFDTSKLPGSNVNPGPFIGVVKNNIDPLRAGRLQVYIPEFGGIENEQEFWVTINYASPYAGAVRWPRDEKERSESNQYDQVNHSYGMWMTPPDIGNYVMVMFVAGLRHRGYWFACVTPELTHYAMPGGAGSSALTGNTSVDKGLMSALDTKPYPCVEFNNINDKLKGDWKTFLSIPKPPHEEQCMILLKQGIEDDKVRGVISSSSQRESPSHVFGISTPGPESPAKVPMDRTNGISSPQYRLGGHTFVMDDGDAKAENRIVRLRTSFGHQIMMSDSKEAKNNFIYIANAEGTAWVELTHEGKILVYGKDSISIRTEKDFNVHADRDINMYAKNTINMFAEKSVITESPGLITTKAVTELNMFGGIVGLKSGSELRMQSDTLTGLKVGTDLFVSTGEKIDITSGTSLSMVTGTFGGWTCQDDLCIVAGKLELGSKKTSLNLEAKTSMTMVAEKIEAKSTKTAIMFDSKTELSLQGENIKLKASKSSINLDAAADTTLKAGKDVVLTGTFVFMNSPKVAQAVSGISVVKTAVVCTVTADPAKEFEKPDSIDKLDYKDPDITMGKYYKWKKDKKPFESTTPIVPTHEPYDRPT